MKRTFLCLLVTCAAAIACAAASQAAPTEITASGTGSVSLPPDTATVNATVDTNAANANDAISKNNAIYDRIVASLAKLGVARGDISLAYYNVSYNPPPRNQAANSPDERYGYTVSRNFSVKVREIASAGRVSDASIGAGATAINGVSFGLSKPNVARDQATVKAVAEAQANAQALAAAATLHIVSIKSIELLAGVSGPGPVPLMRAAAAAPTEFDQSNVNVTVTVSVVFLAEP
ncbi:MAG: SIMPL domain-containing protein [Candidatus Cybelea sp.]